MIVKLLMLLMAIVMGNALVIGAYTQEDDPWFNCHFNGNRVCGQGVPWHGFVHVNETA